MKCVTREDGYDILREIHEGVCGNHVASKRWWGKHTELVSGGPPQCPMLRTLSVFYRLPTEGYTRGGNFR
jgi:hypothetical protein